MIDGRGVDITIAIAVVIIRLSDVDAAIIASIAIVIVISTRSGVVIIISKKSTVAEQIVIVLELAEWHPLNPSRDQVVNLPRIARARNISIRSSTRTAVVLPPRSWDRSCDEPCFKRRCSCCRVRRLCNRGTSVVVGGALVLLLLLGWRRLGSSSIVVVVVLLLVLRAELRFPRGGDALGANACGLRKRRRLGLGAPGVTRREAVAH